MASVTNYRGGDTREVLMKASATYPFEKGDLLFKDPVTGYVMPASIRSNHGTEALNQTAFAQYFAGVALVKNGLQTGETSFRLVTADSEVRVATAGRFEFECDSQTFGPGDLIAVAADTAGCSDQKVDAASTSGSLQEERAIGRAVPGVAGLAGATTRIVIEIKSRIMDADVATAGTYSGTSGQ